MTTFSIIARSILNLSKVNQYIHDCWFDVNDISLAASSVIFHFTRPVVDRERLIGHIGPLRQLEVPYCESFLRIHHVRRWHIEDRERVGLYDFNEATYDPATEIVRITTGIPILLLAEVDELEVSVEETDKIAEVKVRRTLL